MKKLMKFIQYVLIFIISFSIVSASNVQSDEVIKAMKDELARSMKHLKLESLDKPYYIEYTLRVSKNYSAKAILGALVSNTSNESNILTVGVRVGNYNLDNTNFFDVGFSFFGSTDDEETFQNREIPDELNYDVLRHELWLATDAAYKRNSEIFTKKIAILKNIVRKDTIPDFSKIPIKVTIDTVNFSNFDLNQYADITKKLSDIFKNYPSIEVSEVNFEYLPNRIYYVNSEGVEYIKDNYFSGFEATAYTQNKSGIPLIQYFSAYSKNPANLPPVDSLTKGVNAICSNLTAQEQSPTLDETYNGPVLFEGQAAAEVFAQSFAPNLVAQRQPLSEGFSFGMNAKTTSFQKKIGGRVLPEFISVFDSPNESKYRNSDLLGYYQVDDDGVIPERTTLVENGFLKTLLSDRTPIKRVLTSNGHKRNGAPLFSNLFIFPDPMKATPEKDLKSKFLDLVKKRDLQYGILIKKVVDQNIFSTSLMSLTYGQISYFADQGTIPVLEAYKVYPNGKEELIRSVQINSLSPQSFKDIIYVGKENYVLNYLATSVVSSFMSGGDPYIGASIITPSIVFEDLEINPIDKDSPKPPYIPNPFVKKN